MHERNTMGVGLYIFRNIAWLIVAMILYHAIGFRRLVGWGLIASVALLCALAIVCVAAGVVLTKEKRRTAGNIFATVCIPFGIYSLLSGWVVLRRVAIVLGTICILVLAIYFHLIMEGIRFSRRWVQHFAFFAFGARIIVALGFLALILIVYVEGVFWKPLLSASKPATMSVSEQGDLLVATNIRTLQALNDDDMWAALELSEKLDVLQVLADSEACRLGIGHELRVGADVLDEGTLACYSEQRYLIILDTAFLERADPEKAVNSLCHEAFHAYEHRLAELYEVIPKGYRQLSKVQRFGQYRDEFLHYVNGDQNFYKYYTQAVEEDAREYGEWTAEKYLRQISLQVQKYSLEQ